MPINHTTPRVARSLLALLASALTACGAAEDEPVASQSARFSTAPSEPNHEDITRDGLNFLRPEILSALTLANAATDVEFVLVNANHFDDCNFSAGSQVVSSSQAEAVRSLDPALPPESDARAIAFFARSLHALQDFYAHSNWVELGGTRTLVDQSLRAFATLTPYTTVPASGFVVIQGAKPKNSALTRDDDAAYPQSAVVTVKLGKSRSPGLISGTVDYEPGNDCPPAVAMTHDELNKDKSTLVGREQQYRDARSLATAQTRHEWCRLNELARTAWGEVGTARLATWVADGSITPDCQVE